MFTLSHAGLNVNFNPFAGVTSLTRKYRNTAVEDVQEQDYTKIIYYCASAENIRMKILD